MERRQEQAPVPEVLGAVEDKNRSLSEERAEQRIGLAGVELLVRALEDLLDQRRVEDHYEGAVEKRAHSHGAAVAAAARFEVPTSEEHEAQRLDQPGEARARRHVHVHGLRWCHTAAGARQPR